MLRAFGLRMARFGRASTESQRRLFCSNTDVFDRINRAWQKGTWDSEVAKQAEALIFGDRRYEEFTKKERAVVNFFQDRNFEVSGTALLPNTRAALEQEAEQEAFLKNCKKQKP